ncbi:MAG: homoserine kinase [Chloroflexota bacterium]|nr:MAG: homoserine kinase [Chloroflexota bacterium]
MNPKVIVNIPATSANMGPGLDCLGIALDVWNTVQVFDGNASVDVNGYGEGVLPRDETNLVYKGFAEFFRVINKPAPAVKIVCDNNIKLARGMGSSSAALVGGLYAANSYAGNLKSDNEILNIAATWEGHPDNVAPAIFGGMQICLYDGQELIVSQVKVPDDLTAVLFIPEQPMPTVEARKLLSPEISRADAIYNISRSALLVQAFTTGDMSKLRYATQDKLHQPARQKLFFPLNNIIRAAMDAGAFGAFLSGAGSAILAFCKGREYTVGYEMADAAMKSGISGDILVTTPSIKGVYEST